MLLAVAVVVFGGATTDDNQMRWRQGTDLSKAALVEIRGRWVDAPLRGLVEQVGRSRRIPVFVDRRVDPNITVTFSAAGVNWEQFLHQVGKQHGFGFCRLEGIYYFGPVRTAARLPSQFQKLKAWVAKNRTYSANWLQATKLDWKQLASPQLMFQEIASQLDLEWVGPQIPHDLWPATNLPEVSVLLKSVLLTVGFDKWFLISKSGKKLKLIPFPETEAVEYKVRMGKPSSNLLRNLRARFPRVRFDQAGKTVTLEGELDPVVEAIGAVVKAQVVLAGKRVPDATFTAEFAGQRGSVLASVAQQLGLSLNFENQIRPVLNQHVTFSVVDETAESIVTKALQGTGLKFRMNIDSLEVFR